MRDGVDQSLAQALGLFNDFCPPFSVALSLAIHDCFHCPEFKVITKSSNTSSGIGASGNPLTGVEFTEIGCYLKSRSKQSLHCRMLISVKGKIEAISVHT